jgi:hypothetical protein
MKQGPNRKLTLERAEDRFRFCQLHVRGPHLLGRIRLQIGTHHVGTFPQVPLGLPLFFYFPPQTHAGRRVSPSDFEQIIDLRVPRLRNGSYRAISIVAEKNGKHLQVRARKGYHARVETNPN